MASAHDTVTQWRDISRPFETISQNTQQPDCRYWKQDAYSTTVVQRDTRNRERIVLLLRQTATSSNNKYTPRNITAFSMVQKTLIDNPHPRIISFLLDLLERPTLALIMRPEVNIDLDEFTFNSSQDRLQAAKEVSKAFRHIHGLGLVHGNFHKGNVLFSVDGRTHVIHIGLHVLFDDHPSNLFGGQWRWMARELLIPAVNHDDAGPPTQESDVYSLGLVLRWIFTDRIPFHDIQHEVLVLRKRISDPNAAQEMLTRDQMPPDLRGIVLSCLAHDPNQRPSAGEVFDSLTIIAS